MSEIDELFEQQQKLEQEQQQLLEAMNKPSVPSQIYYNPNYDQTVVSSTDDEQSKIETLENIESELQKQTKILISKKNKIMDDLKENDTSFTVPPDMIDIVVIIVIVWIVLQPQIIESLGNMMPVIHNNPNIGNIIIGIVIALIVYLIKFGIKQL